MKKFLILMLILIVAIVGGVYASFGKIVKAGIENVVPMVTKTTATVKDVDISLLYGNAEIKNLAIGNPKGFKAKDVFSVGEVKVKVDVKSLKTDTIVVKSVKIDKVIATYEMKDGITNIAVIQKNVNDFVSKLSGGKTAEPETKAPAKTEKAKDKKVVIKDLSVTNSKLQAVIAGKQLDIAMPDIHMKNIGEKDDKTMGEVFADILNSFSANSLKAVANSTVEVLKDVGSNLGGAADTLKQKSEDLGNTLKGMFK